LLLLIISLIYLVLMLQRKQDVPNIIENFDNTELLVVQVKPIPKSIKSLDGKVN